MPTILKQIIDKYIITTRRDVIDFMCRSGQDVASENIQRVLEQLLGPEGSIQEQAFIQMMNKINDLMVEVSSGKKTVSQASYNADLFVIEHSQDLGIPNMEGLEPVHIFAEWNLSAFANGNTCTYEFVSPPPQCETLVLALDTSNPERVKPEVQVKQPKIDAHPDLKNTLAMEGRSYRAIDMRSIEKLNGQELHEFSDVLYFATIGDEVEVKFWDDADRGKVKFRVHNSELTNFNMTRTSAGQPILRYRSSEELLVNFLAQLPKDDDRKIHLREPNSQNYTLEKTIKALDKAGVQRIGTLGFARAFPDIKEGLPPEGMIKAIKDRALVSYADMAIREALEALADQHIPFTTVDCGYSGQTDSQRKVGAPLIGHLEGAAHARDDMTRDGRESPDEIASTFYPPMSVISSQQNNDVVMATGTRGYRSGKMSNEGTSNPNSPTRHDTIASRTQFVVNGTWGDESPQLAALCTGMLIVEPAGRWTQIEMQNGIAQGKPVVILASPFNYEPQFQDPIGSAPKPPYDQLDTQKYIDLPFGEGQTVRAYRHPADAAMYLGWRNEFEVGLIARMLKRPGIDETAKEAFKILPTLDTQLKDDGSIEATINALNRWKNSNLSEDIDLRAIPTVHPIRVLIPALQAYLQSAEVGERQERMQEIEEGLKRLLPPDNKESVWQHQRPQPEYPIPDVALLEEQAEQDHERQILAGKR